MDQGGGTGALHPVHRPGRRASLSPADADRRHAGIYAKAAQAGHLRRRHQPDGQDQSGKGAGTAAMSDPDRRAVLEAGAAAVLASSGAAKAAPSSIVMMDAHALASAIAAKK